MANLQAIAPRRTNAVDRIIGALVQARRVELGVKDEKLAEALGVTVEQVQKFERGTARIAASQLLAIAETLEAPIGALLPIDDRPARPQGQPVDALTAEVVQISQSLTREGRKLLRQFAGVLTPHYAAGAREPEPEPRERG